MLEHDRALVRDFLHTVEGVSTDYFLIGAGARVLTFDDRFGISGARATLDWDFAIRADDWGHYSVLTERLLAGNPPKFRRGPTEHRFVHSGGGALDLVPYGGIEDAAGSIHWPGNVQMSVRALRAAEPNREWVDVGGGLLVPVAMLPSLALLKLDAYLERRRRGHRKDIQDFDWMLRHYDTAGNTIRIHDELGDSLRVEKIQIEDGGAALLGLDVARAHPVDALTPIRAMLREAQDPWSLMIGDMCAADRPIDDRDHERVRGRASARIRAFEMGIDEACPRGE